MVNDTKPEDLIADGFANVRDAAKFLRLGRSTVYVLMDDGSLPSVKIRGARRIPWVALKQFAAASLDRAA